MAVPTGLEPAISCVTGRRDNHYTTEPLVAEEGFEPTTFGLWARRANQTAPLRDKSLKNGGGKGIRTPAPLTRPLGFQDQSLQPDLGIPPHGAWGRTWTGTRVDSRRILSPVRLPVPPLRHSLFFCWLLDYITKK